MKPAEIGAWRRHFERHPPDANEVLLSLIARLQCADDVGDEDFRPWAYTAEESKKMKAMREEKILTRNQEQADRKLTAFMMG